MENLGNRIFSWVAVLLLVASCGANNARRDTLVDSAVEGTKIAHSIVGRLDWSEVANLMADSNNSPIRHNAQAVGLISVPALSSRCTAFLVADNIIMTNWHCFPSAGHTAGARFYPQFLRGNHELSYQETISYDCPQLITTQKSIDMALLRCTGHPGRLHGVVSLESSMQALRKNDPNVNGNGSGNDSKNNNNSNYNYNYNYNYNNNNQQIYIIHQNCNYYRQNDCAPTKKYSPGHIMESDEEVAGTYSQEDVFYNADTLGGSSGGPVFSSNNHRVIALHHHGYGPNSTAHTSAAAGDAGAGVQNSGVPMPVILRWIQSHLPQVAAEISISEPRSNSKPSLSAEYSDENNDGNDGNDDDYGN